jgi:hypothetical protein
MEWWSVGVNNSLRIEDRRCQTPRKSLGPNKKRGDGIRGGMEWWRKAWEWPTKAGGLPLRRGAI